MSSSWTRATRRRCAGWRSSTTAPWRPPCPERDGEAAGFVLDARTTALVRLAGLVALQTSPQAYEWGVAAVLGAGADHEDIVAVLISLVPVIGGARVSSAAEAIATAIGCDLDARHEP